MRSTGGICGTCTHPERPAIDTALVQGEALRSLAKRYGTSIASLSRHRPHVGKALVRAAERREERLGETLLEKVERLEADSRRLAEKAETEGDLRAAIAANRALLDLVKLMHEMTKPSEAGLREVDVRAAIFAAYERALRDEQLGAPPPSREEPAPAVVVAPKPAPPEPAVVALPPPAPSPPALLAFVTDRSMPQPARVPTYRDEIQQLGDTFANRLRGL